MISIVSLSGSWEKLTRIVLVCFHCSWNRYEKKNQGHSRVKCCVEHRVIYNNKEDLLVETLRLFYENVSACHPIQYSISTRVSDVARG